MIRKSRRESCVSRGRIFSGMKWRRGRDSNYRSALIPGNLLIVNDAKNAQDCQYAESRYATSTQDSRLVRSAKADAPFLFADGAHRHHSRMVSAWHFCLSCDRLPTNQKQRIITVCTAQLTALLVHLLPSHLLFSRHRAFLQLKDQRSRLIASLPLQQFPQY